jgi:hypothetical protein
MQFNSIDKRDGDPAAQLGRIRECKQKGRMEIVPIRSFY